MSTHNNPQMLEDVLEAYLVAAPTEDPRTLAEWIRRYPQYERELMEFAVARSLMRRLPAAPDAEEEEEEVLMARGMEEVENLLRQHRERAATDPTMVDLLAEAKARGVSPRALAVALGLSVALVTKLHRRLIRVASIPRELIEDLARLLERDAATVVRYLAQPPSLATGAYYRAEQAPALGEPQEFFEAVRTDPSLPEEDRQRWLALEPSVEGQ